MKHFLFFLIVFSFVCLSTTNLSNKKSNNINWKKVKTEVDAKAVMDALILPQSTFENTYATLSSLKSEQFFAEADSVIQYNSPFVQVRLFSMVSRTWMYRFTFESKTLKFYSVRQGLLGP